jgi:NADPH:quinone reductase-like Zn-dependent oxidoreductase
MKAVTQTTYGTAEVLAVDDLELPTPGAGEVLVRIEYAGVNAADRHLMTGRPYVMRVMGMGRKGPKQATRGLDATGTIVAVGTSVIALAPGDRVFGVVRGSFAEYAIARADKLSHLPVGVDPRLAAVTPIAGLTALQALRAGRLVAGQRVLVIGAGGGVGMFSVQLAKALGARVTGVCSTGKVAMVTKLGADTVIDYTSEKLSGTYDLIVDTAGGRPLSELRPLLTRKGVLAIVGSEEGGAVFSGLGTMLAGVLTSPFISQRVIGVVADETAADLEVLATHLAAGALTPVIEREYSLEDAPEAMRRFDAGHASGKLLIRIELSEPPSH